MSYTEGNEDLIELDNGYRFARDYCIPLATVHSFIKLNKDDIEPGTSKKIKDGEEYVEISRYLKSDEGIDGIVKYRPKGENRLYEFFFSLDENGGIKVGEKSRGNGANLYRSKIIEEMKRKI